MNNILVVTPPKDSHTVSPRHMYDCSHLYSFLHSFHGNNSFTDGLIEPMCETGYELCYNMLSCIICYINIYFNWYHSPLLMLHKGVSCVAKGITCLLSSFPILVCGAYLSTVSTLFLVWSSMNN